MHSLADVKAGVLSVVRRGPRTVLWTHPPHGFGNVLYGWMHAHRAQCRGEETVALLNGAGEQWMPHLAGLADRLVCRRNEVRLTDRRELGDFFIYGHDYDEQELDEFIEDVLLPAPLTKPPVDLELTAADLVVTIRRGDYWSVPRYRARYAFDTRAYLDVAMTRQVDLAGPIRRAHVISDDIEWCKGHLGWMSDLVGQLTFAPETHTPRDHFATMVAAHRLVLTNTTFGYWGGYVAGTRHGHDQVTVVAPRFHARGLPGGPNAVHVDPRWSMVEHIAGGWVEPPPEDLDDASGQMT